MKAHDIKLSNGVKTFLGKLIVTDKALVFLCASTGSALLEGAALGLGGKMGLLLKELSNKGNYGQISSEITEEDLKGAAAEMPNSIIFEASKIEKIQQNWAFRMIKWDNKKIGVPSGFSKELKQELIPWAKKWNIEIKGF